MSTPSQNTGGITPGIICYVSLSSVPSVWLVWGGGDTSQGACGLFQDSSGWYGRATFTDATMINSGWNLRIILFWANG
jgi:hypothetical protein